jgi:transcriptional regulator with XRE-family HTH domain
VARKLIGAKDGIGARIEELRERNGKSQEQLADELKVSRSKINMWERGERDLKSQDIIALSKALDVSSDYLLCMIDDVITQDTDIRKLNKKYGLSERSLNKLSNMNIHIETKEFIHDLTPAIRFINLMIENISSIDAAEWFRNYEEARDDKPVRNEEGNIVLHLPKAHQKGELFSLSSNDAKFLYVLLLSEHVKFILSGQKDQNTVFSKLETSIKNMEEVMQNGKKTGKR